MQMSSVVLFSVISKRNPVHMFLEALVRDELNESSKYLSSNSSLISSASFGSGDSVVPRSSLGKLTATHIKIDNKETNFNIAIVLVLEGPRLLNR